MANTVSVILKAIDQTGQVIRGAEARLTKFAGFATKVGSAVAGIFIAGKLGSFVKESVRLAGEADQEMGKTLNSLTRNFEDAKIAVGRAILGSNGIKAALDVAADALTLFAVAIEKPADAIKAVFTNLWNSIGWIVGKLVAGIGALTNNAEMRRIGAELQDRAVLAMAGNNAIENLIAPSRGASSGLSRNQGRGFTLTPGADYGPAGGLLNANVTQVRGQELIGTLIPSGDAIADALDKALLGASMQVPKLVGWFEMQRQFQESFAEMLSFGIAYAFDEALSGGIADGFAALTGEILSGFGSMLQQFGIVALKAALLQSTFLKALSNLLPGGGVASAIGMIALGSALKALGNAARQIFSGGAQAAATGAYESGSAVASTPRENLVVYLPHGAYAQVDSPAFQEFITEVIARGAGRGVVFRPA